MCAESCMLPHRCVVEASMHGMRCMTLCVDGVPEVLNDTPLHPITSIKGPRLTGYRNTVRHGGTNMKATLGSCCYSDVILGRPPPDFADAPVLNINTSELPGTNRCTVKPMVEYCWLRSLASIRPIPLYYRLGAARRGILLRHQAESLGGGDTSRDPLSTDGSLNVYPG